MPKNHTTDASRRHTGKGTSPLYLGTERKVTGHKHNALHIKKNDPVFYRQALTSIAAKLEHTFLFTHAHIFAYL